MLDSHNRDRDVASDVFAHLPARTGHFLLESGHHGPLWLELPRLCLEPRPIERLAHRLADRLAVHRPEVICAPLVEGAFVGLWVAGRLGARFSYTTPVPGAGGLYPVDYPLPASLADVVAGRRVAVVNDVINAGSAVRGSCATLAAAGAEVIAIGALATLGPWAASFAAARGVALEALAGRATELWTPADCPLCRDGMPLERAPA